MNQAMNISLALALASSVALAHAAASSHNEAKLIGAWQEGLTPRLAAGTPKQLQMAQQAGLLGEVTLYKADHSFVIYPPCGPKKEDLRKAGLDSIKGTWQLSDTNDLVSEINVKGQSMKIDAKLSWQDGQMVATNKYGSVSQRAGRYAGPLPPAC